MEHKKEVTIRENSKMKPDCFGIRFENQEEENIFVLSFGNTEENNVEIMAEIDLNEAGFKTVLRRMIAIACEFEEKTGIDILEQIVEETEEAGENSGTSK